MYTLAALLKKVFDRFAAKLTPPVTVDSLLSVVAKTIDGLNEVSDREHFNAMEYQDEVNRIDGLRRHAINEAIRAKNVSAKLKDLIS